MAGISGDTLYSYLRGEGQNAKVETILAIARAAGVPEPAIERSLNFSGASVGAPPMLVLLREAGAAIEAATRLLGAEEATRPAVPLTDAEASRLAAAREAKPPDVPGSKAG